MITPTKLNLTLWRGATFRKTFTYYSGADELTPPKNLTGYTGRMVLRTSDGSTLDELTTENGGIILGGATGTITFYISDEDTTLISWKSASYEFFLTDALGDTDIYFYGAIAVRGAEGL